MGIGESGARGASSFSLGGRAGYDLPVRVTTRPVDSREGVEVEAREGTEDEEEEELGSVAAVDADGGGGGMIVEFERRV